MFPINNVSVILTKSPGQLDEVSPLQECADNLKKKEQRYGKEKGFLLTGRRHAHISLLGEKLSNTSINVKKQNLLPSHLIAVLIHGTTEGWQAPGIALVSYAKLVFNPSAGLGALRLSLCLYVQPRYCRAGRLEIIRNKVRFTKARLEGSISSAQLCLVRFSASRKSGAYLLSKLVASERLCSELPNDNEKGWLPATSTRAKIKPTAGGKRFQGPPVT